VRNERKYKIISLLTTLLAVLLLGNCFREYFRMEAAVDRQHEEYVQKGAKTYAANCASCHGPRGEGIIGMPLNRKAYQVDYETPAGKDVYNMLQQTIRQGRPGNDAHPEWKVVSGTDKISYTTMPSWGRDFGGPLDDDYVKALALFIMNPDASQWQIVGDEAIAPFPDPGLSQYTKPEDIPVATSENKDVDAAGKALLRNVGKTQCLACHTIGSAGGKIGPDLTHVGSWGVDQTYLENWIKYPSPNPADKEHPEAIAHDVRMPVYWSANRATRQPDLNLTQKVISEGPYYMPRFKGKLTDDEIATIAKFLMGLK
jgi:mono/diheme cytochrome c family protein